MCSVWYALICSAIGRDEILEALYALIPLVATLKRKLFIAECSPFFSFVSSERPFFCDFFYDFFVIKRYTQLFRHFLSYRVTTASALTAYCNYCTHFSASLLNIFFQINAKTIIETTHEILSDMGPAQRTVVTLPTDPKINTAGNKMII